MFPFCFIPIDTLMYLNYNCLMSYVIIKKVKRPNTTPTQYLPVILLNSDTEVWEFESRDKAEEMKDIFQTNSDSGHLYEVKKI